MQKSRHNAKTHSKIIQWQCPNCGQLFFNTPDLALPAKCRMCRRFIQWQEHGKHVRRWKCPNCGQILFTASDDKPPDMCDYCNDFTTWERVYE